MIALNELNSIELIIESKCNSISQCILELSFNQSLVLSSFSWSYSPSFSRMLLIDSSALFLRSIKILSANRNRSSISRTYSLQNSLTSSFRSFNCCAYPSSSARREPKSKSSSFSSLRISFSAGSSGFSICIPLEARSTAHLEHTAQVSLLLLSNLARYFPFLPGW